MDLKLHIKKLPKFEYDLRHTFDINYGSIRAGNVLIHQIADTNDFYQSLGFTEEMHRNGELPEEFIWTEYLKDGAKRADVCLQAKIIAYLCKNVGDFRPRYKYSYRYWIGSCQSEKMNDGKDCTNCKKHP
jgi:hypothetical protein